MKRFWALLLVVFSLFSIVAHGETLIEQIEFKEPTLLLGILSIKRVRSAEYFFIVILYNDKQLIPVGNIPSSKIYEGFSSQEEYLEYIEGLGDTPLTEWSKYLQPNMILISTQITEADQFDVYILKKDYSIEKFSSFPKEWFKSGVSIEDFIKFLNEEIRPTKEYESNISNDMINISNGISKGFSFENFNYHIANLFIITSFNDIYNMKTSKRK